MSRHTHYTGPDTTDPAATRGLSRRLALRAVSAIEQARARGDWRTAEDLIAAELDRRAQRDRQTARDRAADLARLPMGERVST